MSKGIGIQRALVFAFVLLLATGCGMLGGSVDTKVDLAVAEMNLASVIPVLGLSAYDMEFSVTGKVARITFENAYPESVSVVNGKASLKGLVVDSKETHLVATARDQAGRALATLRVGLEAQAAFSFEASAAGERDGIYVSVDLGDSWLFYSFDSIAAMTLAQRSWLYTQTISDGVTTVLVLADEVYFWNTYLDDPVNPEPEEDEEPPSRNVVDPTKGEEDRTAKVTGYVTDGRGGPRVADARVTWQQWETYTDAQGYFSLDILPNSNTDLFVYHPMGGVTRVQGANVAAGQTRHYNVPTRPIFDPTGTIGAPVVHVNIRPGQVLTGNVPVSISGMVQSDLFLLYVDFASEGRTGPAGRDSNTLNLTINSRLYPNGDTFLRVLVYDLNENASLQYIPVTIQNEVTHEAVPGVTPRLQVVSHTRGQNIRFYGTDAYDQLQAQADRETNPMKAMALRSFLATEADQPLNAVQWVEVSWNQAPGEVSGYNVYRSFDNESNYVLLGSVTGRVYQDRCPELVSGRTAYYKVVAYNSLGEGEGRVRPVTPLPAYDVYLVSPSHGDREVGLTPTLRWTYHADGQFPLGVEFEEILRVHDVTWWRVIDTVLIDSLTYEIPAGILEPATAYTWDIFHSDAFYIETMDAFGISASISVANSWDEEGSINGEFVFTTISH